MHYGLLIKTRLELGDMSIFPTPSGSQTGKLFYCLFLFFCCSALSRMHVRRAWFSNNTFSGDAANAGSKMMQCDHAPGLLAAITPSTTRQPHPAPALSKILARAMQSALFVPSMRPV
jgi:hypothetical protein